MASKVFKVVQINKKDPVHCSALCYICLCSCRFGLENRVIIKIWTHPCYPTLLQSSIYNWDINIIFELVVKLESMGKVHD